MAAWGSVIGLCFAAGLIVIASWRIATRRTLLRDVSRQVGIASQNAVVSRYLENVLHQVLANSPQSPWGSDRHIDKLLAECGSTRTRVSFRSSQLFALASGLGILALWCLLRQVTHHQNNPVIVGALLVGTFPISGWLVKASLADDVAKRARHVGAQLPGALELLAFSVSAGEPVISGLQRVSSLSSGALSQSLELAVRQIESGSSMAHALHELSSSVDSSQLARAVHAIDLALERGTPLADVLRAQASDARAQHARELMVLAGKKETAMMLPVVFLILPMIVLVAIYPGLVALKVM